MSDRSRVLAIALSPDRATFWQDVLRSYADLPFEIAVCATEDALRAADPEVVVGHENNMLAYVGEPGPRFRWAHFLSAGIERAIEASNGSSRPIRITTSSGIHGTAMREYALMALLHFCKDVKSLQDNQAARQWRPAPFRLLSGKTLLIVGTGSIGAAVARAAGALDMTVWGVSKHGELRPEFSRVEPVERLRSILPDADFVLLAVPLTNETQGLFSAETFAAMKTGSVLINVARGALIDDAALLAALRSGRVAGAALDAFSVEPLPPSSELWSEPHLLVTPHAAGRFADGHRLGAEQLVRNLGAYLAGNPMEAEVDLRLGY